MTRRRSPRSDRRALENDESVGDSVSGRISDIASDTASDTARDTARDDARLVLLYLQGDTQAFEGIYARYLPSLVATASIMIASRADAADVVHDVFAIAMERLHQLENPSALASWLTQILRREVYRRSRDWRDFISLTQASVDVAELSAQYDSRHEAATAIANETATLFRRSLDGLDRRDRTLFETTARNQILGQEMAGQGMAGQGMAGQGMAGQGMAGQKMATQELLDSDTTVTSDWPEPASTRMMTRRMRQRLVASCGAYLVARYGQQSCPLLRQLLRHWNGEFDPLIRKRVTRHIESCPRCDDLRRRMSSLTLISLILASPTAVEGINPDTRHPPEAFAGLLGPSETRNLAGRIVIHVCTR